MSMDRISALKSSQTTLALIPSKIDPFAEEDLLEKDIKYMISEYRKGKISQSLLIIQAKI
jgi:hypothetical protein